MQAFKTDHTAGPSHFRWLLLLSQRETVSPITLWPVQWLPGPAWRGELEP